MGRGGQHRAHSGIFNWDEIKSHNSQKDRWIVIDGQVYDVTEWSKRHPGGSRMIGHYAGQDATVSFQGIFCPSLGAKFWPHSQSKNSHIFFFFFTFFRDHYFL